MCILEGVPTWVGSQLVRTGFAPGHVPMLGSGTTEVSEKSLGALCSTSIPNPKLTPLLIASGPHCEEGGRPPEASYRAQVSTSKARKG